MGSEMCIRDRNKVIVPVEFLPYMKDAVPSMEIDALVCCPCMMDHFVVASAAVADVCTEIVVAVAVETADYKEIGGAPDTENDERAAAVAVVASETDQAAAAAVASCTVNEIPYHCYTVNKHSAFDERSHQSNYLVDLHASYVGAVLFVTYHLSSH